MKEGQREREIVEKTSIEVNHSSFVHYMILCFWCIKTSNLFLNHTRYLGIDWL